MSCCCFLCFIASLVCTVQVLLRLDLRLRLVGPMVTLFLVRQMFFPALFRRAGVLALLSVVSHSIIVLQLSSSLGFLCLVEESDEFLSGWCS